LHGGGLGHWLRPEAPGSGGDGPCQTTESGQVLEPGERGETPPGGAADREQRKHADQQASSDKSFPSAELGDTHGSRCRREIESREVEVVAEARNMLCGRTPEL